MTLLRPQKAHVHWWANEVMASAGGFRQEIVVYQDNTVEIVHDSRTMGIGKERFMLYGRHEMISTGYGWIYIDTIHKVTDESPEQFQAVNIDAYDGSLLLEYFRTPGLPHVQHPHDMMNVSARWIEQFDMLLIVQPFVDEMIGGFEYMFANPSEYKGADFTDQQAVEAVAQLLRSLDKQKFSRVDDSTSAD